jgi:hypothetical protein
MGLVMVIVGIILFILVATEVITAGILFIFSLFVVAWCLQYVFRRSAALTSMGSFALIENLFLAVYSGLLLFMDFDFIKFILK